MKPTSIVTLVAATLLAVGSAYWLNAREPRKPYPKATPPPPPSPIYHESKEPAPNAEEIERMTRGHVDEVVLGIERALAARDPQQRETAFTFLLPELIQVAPQRVVEMVAHQEPGEARDALRGEVARQWITKDRDAAIRWMKSLGNEAEIRDSATVAVRTLSAMAPDQAIYVADQFGIGRDDGSLERMVQLWAEDDIDRSLRWLRAQPPGPKTDQLRARIDLVRERKAAR